MSQKSYIKTSLTGAADRQLPVVALVGRPNVGKSTLFNRLTRSRRAIIDPTPGMTRDRLYGTISRDEGSYRLVDTGGLEDRPGVIVDMIRNQTHRAIEEAEVVVFLIDGREGLLASDEEIMTALRQTGKNLLLFVNKIDGGESQLIDSSVYSLGFNEVLTGSAEHGLGIAGLLAAIDEAMVGRWKQRKTETGEAPIRLAIIGRPNVGKSSIVNKLLNEERVMVSEVAGTTRDPIDSYLQYKKHGFCLVDTAGIRRRGRIKGSQESLSVLMANRQVADADVIALMIDATDVGASQDAAIAGIADKAFKPIVVVVNKWDLIENKDNTTTRQFEERIRRRLKFLETSPFVFVSAMSGQRVTRILDLALDVISRMDNRITTGVLNRFVETLSTVHRIPNHKGRGVKIFYMTQVETRPPTFLVVVNRKDPLHFSQKRFLMNRIREAFNLDGVPMRLVIKPRDKRSD